MNHEMGARSREIALNGEWDFAYQARPEPFKVYDPALERTAAPEASPGCGGDAALPIPPPDAFECRMPVPGYWDDHLERLQRTAFWSRDCRFNPEYRAIRFPLGRGKPADASLPHLLGVGWYRKRFRAGAEPLACLTIGGAVMDVDVFVNGRHAGRHEGHLTPFTLEIGPFIEPNAENEVLLAVSNLRGQRASCVIRGYKGRSGGIRGSVVLHLSEARVNDLYLYPKSGALRWGVQLAGQTDGMEVSYALRDGEGRDIVSGVRAADRESAQWETGAEGVAEWSDRSPCLHTAIVELRRDGQVFDRIEQPFGLRRIEADGQGLRLNGRPVFLRGLTEHAYFPLTCTPPLDTNSYRADIRMLKAIGFNYVRFHTWAPPEPYVRACDELGVLVQVEAPNGFSDAEWEELLATYRRHPSVVIYCCGNETKLDDQMIDRIERMAQRCREAAPDALFCPMHGMSRVDWCVEASMPGVVAEPFPHHADRLARLCGMSDVFAPQKGPLGILPHGMEDTNRIETRLAIYGRPLLMHEMGILDTYIDLDLENRYAGTRIGSDLYAGARAYLGREGLVRRAPRYYANACRRAASVRKNYIEKARLLAPVAGYDYLGAIDAHWHRTGYSTGILNEFHELKPGECEADILRYNGESVLLCDMPPQRNHRYGDRLTFPLVASLYGRQPMPGGTLHWTLRDSAGTMRANGGWDVPRIANGVNAPLGEVRLEVPELPAPDRLTLAVRLSGGAYDIENAWAIWAFPALPMPEDPRIVGRLDDAALRRLGAGESLLLLGTEPLPSLPFRPLMAGRTVGTAATVIEDHPLLQGFPHDGFCDWQFQAMLGGSRAVVFEDIPFDPIIEYVSSYKLIVKQAAMFEWRVEDGRLLVCSLSLHPSDPGAVYLLRLMRAYLSSERFQPRARMDSDTIRLLASRAYALDTESDEGLPDANAQALLDAANRPRGGAR